mgnify:CR=1 FL=1
MNERIKELALKANIEFTYDPTETPPKAFVECWEDELVAFAELITKRVIQTLEFHGQADAIPYLQWMFVNELGINSDETRTGN